MIIYGPVVIVLDETCWSFLAPGTSCNTPCQCSDGELRHLSWPKTHGTTRNKLGEHFRLWNLCAHALSKQWTWLLAPTWHTVPIRDKVYLKGSTPKWSTSEHCSPSTDALLQCLTGERESTSQPSSSDLINQTSRSSSSKGKKTYTGVHLRTCSCQIFWSVADRWRKKWSCGTSPAESFMTLPLPGCWSLTKVCPVELRSTMDTFKGSTSAKVPGVKWGCSMLFLKWGYPSWMVYFMANPIN